MLLNTGCGKLRLRLEENSVFSTPFRNIFQHKKMLAHKKRLVACETFINKITSPMSLDESYAQLRKLFNVFSSLLPSLDRDTSLIATLCFLVNQSCTECIADLNNLNLARCSGQFLINVDLFKSVQKDTLK